MWLQRGQRIFYPMCRWVWKMTVHGAEHVPTEGGLVLTPNHTSFADPWFIAMISPRKPIRYLINEESYKKSRVGKVIFDSLGVIGQVRNPALTIFSVVDSLERGEVVGVFPEGRVSHDGLMTRCQHGIGWIAALSGKPVVPTGLKGMFEAMPRTAKFPRRAIVSLHLGAPLSFASAPVPDPKPEQVHEFSCAVTESIARLLGQESRLDQILPEAPAADVRPLLERVRRKRAKSE